MAVVRRVSIGVVVAIFGIATALSVVYPAGAKPAGKRHAQCAKASRSKLKRTNRRARCKKASRPRHSRSDGAKTVAPTGGTGVATGTGGAPTGTETGTKETGAATGRGTVRSSPGPVLDVPPRAPLLPVPATVTVNVTATYPRTLSITRTITERNAVLNLYEVAEKWYSDERMAAGGLHTCPAEHEGEAKLELLYLTAPEASPAYTVDVPNDCELSISLAGHETVERLEPHILVALVQKLLGVELEVG
jgi:hypothetical protein